jgi:putative serine protease PepD
MARRRGDAVKLALAALAGGLSAGILLLAGSAITGMGAAAGDPGSSVVTALYRKASPAVVQVQASDRTGSGFLVDRRGHVVTNAHVVGDDTRVRVEIGGRTIDARVQGVEPSVDVAVLALAAPAGDVAPLSWDPSPDLAIGDPVVAIGAPFGLRGSLSSGLVSGLRRQIESPNGFPIRDVIQTDAALNPGNSGGPVLDLAGRVVGIATQIATRTGVNDGVGFAIPAGVARRTADAIIATGHADLPYLGIVGQDSGGGVSIATVAAGGPSDGRLLPGDLIVAVGGEPVDDNDGLGAALAPHAPGARVTVSVVRGGERTDVVVVLGRRPGGTSA